MCGSKNFFDGHSKKIFFSHKFIILDILTLESKLNFFFFLLHHCFCCSCCFEFSYALPFVQVSVDCATLGSQTNRWTASAAAIRNTNDEEIFKCELTFKKLWKYIFASNNKDYVILNVHNRSCFTKVCGMGRIFDKNSFILGMKYSFLENTCSPL